MPKLSAKQQNSPTSSLELSLFTRGYTRVIGIDEAGRGCWAGPVAIGAYLFTSKSKIIPGVRDSKLLSPAKRNILLAEFVPADYRVSLVSPALIDARGISNVIAAEISSFITCFNDGQTFFIIDGVFKDDFGPHSLKIIKGDLKHYAIAAASIAAKVVRDTYMEAMDKLYPEYQFSKHKGYGTKMHTDILKAAGITPLHRRSYKPVKAIGESLFTNDFNRK